MKFEIINPSDPYTMDAVDLEVGAVAVCLLGDGKYALNGIGEARGIDVPIFLLGGHDEWFVKTFGMNYEDAARHVLEHRNSDLAAALESVALTSGKRSSMNDIGGRAKSLAVAVRGSIAVKDAA